jgi:methylamine dehydrogenase heavy chain
MKFSWRSTAVALTAAAGIAGASTATAAEPLPVEKLVAQTRIPSTGPLVYASDNGRLLLADAVTLKWQAALGLPGWRGQFILPKAGNLAYLTNTWWERGNQGKRTDYVEIWDVPTAMSTGVIIEVPPRLALRGNDKTMIGLSSDEKFLFLQNATPATSVSVVDMTTKKFAAEIPMPGCFGVYPVTTAPNKFVALCGDGQAATVTVDAKGKSTSVERSGPIFNADVDPLFSSYVRDGDMIYFVSYNGSVYKVDVSGATARLVEQYSIVTGVEGGWKPAGEQLLAFDPAGKVMFVLMFPDSKDGDHRSYAKEVWAVDVTGKKVLSRSTIASANGVAFGPMPKPALLMNDNDSKSLVRYEVNPGAGYSVRTDKKMVVGVGQRLEVR